MKRGKRDFKFSNRWLYTFIILGIFAVVGVGVYAYGTSSPSTFGHSASEIDLSGVGNIISSGYIHGSITGGDANLGSSIYEISGTNIAGQTVYAYGSMCVGNSAGDCSGTGGTVITSGGISGPGLTAKSASAPYVEIISTSGKTPYIDFANDASTSTDYDARIILMDDNLLRIEGALLDSKEGFYSSTSHAGTGNAAYFPYGFYSPGTYSNWLYGITYMRYGAKIEGDSSTSITSGSFIYSSDKSLKTNIIQLNNALEKVKQLEGVSFNWKETGRKDMGLIAQDVEKVIPEIVHTDEEGLKSVEYGNLVAILIEAVKEQQEEIDSLQKQIDELKN